MGLLKLKKRKISKREKVILILYFLGVIGTILVIIFADKIYGESSVFKETVSDNDIIQLIYSKLPSIIGTIIIVICEMTLYYILKVITKASLKRIGNKGITVAKLIFSFLKWFLFILGILFTLAFWGVDTTAIFTSAGVLTLVIGLGANSLISDIISGIFIVFDNNFKVDDIVNINSFRGVVKEIGIRTTKLISDEGNTCIIKNSEITSVINLTDDLSLIKSIVKVSYKESLLDVEKLINDHLDEIKLNCPLLVKGPFYKGVDSLNNYNYDLVFTGYVKENDIYQSKRDLNRALLLFMNKYNVKLYSSMVIDEKNEK